MLTRHRSDLVARRATRPTAHAQPGSGLEGAKKGGRGSEERAEAGLPEDACPKISGQSSQAQAPRKASKQAGRQAGRPASQASKHARTYDNDSGRRSDAFEGLPTVH